jgi:hypothetical protein
MRNQKAFNVSRNKRNAHVWLWIPGALFLCAALISLSTWPTRAQSQGTPVEWVSLTNARATGNHIEHNGEGYFAKGQTRQLLQGAGYFEWTYDGDYNVVGFGNNDDEINNASSSDLQFAFSSGTSTSLACHENGSYRGETTVAIGDTLRIEIAANGDVLFKRNQTTLTGCTLSNPAKSYPYYLVFEGSNTEGNGINNAVGGGVVVKPYAPVVSVASQSASQVVLDWPDVADGTTSYTVERRWREDTPVILSTTTASTFTDTNGGAGFAVNEPYRYRVYATNPVGNGPFSEPAFATRPPATLGSIGTSPNLVVTPVVPPKPSAGGYVYCPTYGAKIMRVTDADDGGEGGTAYSYLPSFNKDNTKILIVGLGKIADFDAVNFRVSNKVTIPIINLAGVNAAPELADALWSDTHANKLYAHASVGNQIFSYDVSTREWSEVVNLQTAGITQAGEKIWQMTKSRTDDDLFVFSITPNVGWGWYRPSTQTGGRMVRSLVNETKVSKSGRYVYVFMDSPYVNDVEANLYDLQTQINVGLQDIADLTPGHYDLGTNLLVGGENRTPGVNARRFDDPHDKYDLLPHSPHEFTDGTDAHFSMLADNEEWALFGAWSNAAVVFREEFVQVKTDGSGQVRRLLHHHTKYNDYLDSVRGNISRDGKFIAFTSNWSNVNGRRDMWIAQIAPAPSSAPSVPAVAWQNIENTSSTGGTVRHNGGGYFALARSQQQIASGAGYFEFTYDGHYGVAALNRGNDEAPGGGFSTLDYALVFYPSINAYDIRELGQYSGDGAAAAGDVFRIEIKANGDVVYSKNGTPFRTVSNPSKTYPYYLLFQTQEIAGNSISNAKFHTPAAVTSATFVSIDSATSGNWKGVYGADGYNVIGDASSYPAYAQVTPSGHSSYTWLNPTSDRRGLQKSAGGSTERIAATWFTNTDLEIDVNLTDGQTHRLALYCLDWDYGLRTQTVEVRDASTSALLDTRSVSTFAGGKYVVWNLSGHVKLKVTRTGGYNAVVSGLFFN